MRPAAVVSRAICCAALFLLVPSISPPHPSDVAPFEVIVLPDAQNYTAWTDPNIFDDQTDWIAKRAHKDNIVFVTQVGDVTDQGNCEKCFLSALRALDTLKRARIPFSVTLGNHDLHVSSPCHDSPANGCACPDGPRDCSCRHSDLQSPSIANAKRFFSSLYDKDYKSDVRPRFSPDGFSFAQDFSASGFRLLHLNIRDTPDCGTLDWAATELSDKRNVGKPTIISTHDFLDIGGDISWSGNDIWRHLVLPFSQVFMVLNGHDAVKGQETADEARCVSRNEPLSNHQGTRCPPGDDGVLLLHADYQDLSPCGGAGFLRTIVFQPAKSQIEITTYSPFIDSYKSDFTGHLVYEAHFNATANTVRLTRLLSQSTGPTWQGAPKKCPGCVILPGGQGPDPAKICAPDEFKRLKSCYY